MARGRSLLPEGRRDNKHRVSFAALLGELVASAKGARGAVFCGHDGEFVELLVAQPPPSGCGQLTDYDLKVIGAHLAAPWLRLQDGLANGGAGSALEMTMRCKDGALLCARLPEGYYLVLLLGPAAHVPPAFVALRRTAERLAEHL
jgi:predicted regulator of Ras-like GTPase activity (Roadblock/LC7/MglB family)